MLVPAPVIVPLSGSGLATLLVSTLVSGPTPWIAPAVRTAFPEGRSRPGDVRRGQSATPRSVAVKPPEKGVDPSEAAEPREPVS